MMASIFTAVSKTVLVVTICFDMKKLFLSLLLFCTVAQADALKIRIWSGFPPGGTTSNVARLVQQSLLEEDPSATIIVEYAPGASGVLALRKLSTLTQTQYVELLIDGSNQLITSYLTDINSVNLDTDIQVVTPIGYTQMVIMSSKKSKITDIKSYKALTTQRKVNFASAGFGSMTFSTTAYMAYKSQTMDALVHVPYKGPSEFYVDLINGNIDIASDYVVSGAPLINNGSLVAVAVTGKKRSMLLPEVKTLSEQGIDKFPLNPWFGIFTNNNDSDKIQQVRYLLVKALSRNTVARKFHDMGIELVSPEEMSNSSSWYSQEKQEFRLTAKVLKQAMKE